MVLAEETCQGEEAEKAKTNLALELAVLHDQMVKAKVNAVVEFQVSQPFFDTCDIYYGDGFDNCLKQVGVVYRNLDLFQIIIDDIVLPTPRGDDVVSDETVDFVHMVEQEVKDINSLVVAQPTSKGPDATVVLSTVDLTTVDSPSTVNLTVPDAPLS